MGEPLDIRHAFVICDNKQYYAFHKAELYEWVVNNQHDTNPYTNNILSPNIIDQISRFTDTYIEFNMDEYNAKLTSFFVHVESFGCYADMEKFKKLSYTQKCNFCKELYQYDAFRKALPAFDNTMEPLEYLQGIFKADDSLHESCSLLFALHLSYSSIIEHIVELNTFDI